MITIKSFVFNPVQVNTYILHDETNKCVIIDAGMYYENEKREIKKYIAEMQLVPEKLLSTHYHFDHILGNKFVAETFDISIEAHSSMEDMFKKIDFMKVGSMFGIKIDDPPQISKFLEDGDIIYFGNSKLMVLHIPGHAPESLVYYSKEQKFIIAGDVIFEGSIGRTDLPGGNYNSLIKNIKDKLMILPDDVQIYSGHGNTTTIGRERRYNPFLK